jgi:preprotein translocase subunit SecA
LIISGPVPQGDRHEFNELKPKIENLVASISKWFFYRSKKLLKEGKTKEGGVLLLRAYRSLPKKKPSFK